MYKRRNMGFASGSAVRNLPVLQEMWVWSLSREDPLEKGMATYSSIPAWRIPWWATAHRVTKSWTWLKWLSTQHSTWDRYNKTVSTVISVVPSLSFKKFIHYFFLISIYLAAPDLSCGSQDLQSPLQLMGSLVVAWELQVAACGIC